MSRSKARRSYCLSHFGRGLKVEKIKLVALLLGGVGGSPTKEARSTKLDPPLHANNVGINSYVEGERGEGGRGSGKGGRMADGSSIKSKIQKQKLEAATSY
jgi:hypothetical protein